MLSRKSEGSRRNRASFLIWALRRFCDCPSMGVSSIDEGCGHRCIWRSEISSRSGGSCRQSARLAGKLDQRCGQRLCVGLCVGPSRCSIVSGISQRGGGSRTSCVHSDTGIYAGHEVYGDENGIGREPVGFRRYQKSFTDNWRQIDKGDSDHCRKVLPGKTCDSANFVWNPGNSRIHEQRKSKS